MDYSSSWDDPNTTLPGTPRPSSVPLPRPLPTPLPQSAPELRAELRAELLREPKVTRPIGADELGLGPSVAREQWVRALEVEAWETAQMLVTGKRSITRALTYPPARSLPRPQRFRPHSKWRGVMVFAVLLIIMVILTFGAVQAAHLSDQLLGAPATTAPHTVPTMSATLTPGTHH
jgi:hypothetical protein